MSDPRLLRPRLVIIDSRRPGEPPLGPILERAATAHDIHLVTSIDRALETVSGIAPVGVLLHAEFDAAPGLPPSGPIFAALCRRFRPELPLLLFSGSTAGPSALALAQAGIRAPLVAERRLAASFDEVLSALHEQAVVEAHVRRVAMDGADGADESLPEGFLIERWLARVEEALLRASLREHDSPTEAAAAVAMTLQTFLRRLGRFRLELPNRSPQPGHLQECLLWSSSSPAPSWVEDACMAEGVTLRTSPTGMLDRPTLCSPAVLAAAVEPSNAGGAVDAWLLQRSIRPFLLTGSPRPPMGFLLEELCVSGPAGNSAALVGTVLRAGRAAACLHLDEQLDLRFGFRPDGQPAWPLDVPAILRRLDARVLRLAEQVTPTGEAAARTVGLPPATYRSRLRRGRHET